MHQRKEVSEAEGLREVLVRGEIVLRRPFGIAAHQDTGDAEFVRLVGELEPGLAGHAHVGDDEIDGVPCQHVPGDRNATRRADAKLSRYEGARHDIEDLRIVVDDKDMFRCHSTNNPDTGLLDQKQSPCQDRAQ